MSNDPFWLFVWPDGRPIEGCHPARIVEAVEVGTKGSPTTWVTEQEGETTRSYLLPIYRDSALQIKGTANASPQNMVVFVEAQPQINIVGNQPKIDLRVDLVDYDVWRTKGCPISIDFHRAVSSEVARQTDSLAPEAREIINILMDDFRLRFERQRIEFDQRSLDRRKAALQATHEK